MRALRARQGGVDRHRYHAEIIELKRTLWVPFDSIGAYARSQILFSGAPSLAAYSDLCWILSERALFVIEKRILFLIIRSTWFLVSWTCDPKQCELERNKQKRIQEHASAWCWVVGLLGFKKFDKTLASDIVFKFINH
jgi:hypothetical protein